jgi:hypothetical protein
MLLGDGSSVAYDFHATEELSPCGIPARIFLTLQLTIYNIKEQANSAL